MRVVPLHGEEALFPGGHAERLGRIEIAVGVTAREAVAVAIGVRALVAERVAVVVALAVAIALAIRFIDPVRADKLEPFDGVGQLLASLGVAGLAFGLSVAGLDLLPRLRAQVGRDLLGGLQNGPNPLARRGRRRLLLPPRAH